MEVFIEVLDQVNIYFYIVFWSPSSKTALAEAELEYPENHISKSIFVEFPMESEGFFEVYNNLSACIWTTTPWTLIANECICINEKFTYSILKHSSRNKHYIVSTELISSLSSKIKDLELVKTFSGSLLLNTSCYHPFSNKARRFYHGDHVTNSAGSGLVIQKFK
jgi:isoleucyl-tRNA synthetase